MTPEKIIELGEPIEQVYEGMVDELLVNIAGNLRGATWTALRQLETLERLGQLNTENARIINEWTKHIPEALRKSMKHAREEALKQIEDKLAKAAKDGYIEKPLQDTSYDAIRFLATQAADKLNLVNTTMLNSSSDAYRKGVAAIATVTEENQELAQSIMNQAASNIGSGITTRTQALRDAILQMSDEGITGFYDRAGRAWSAEAYVNMDIRTTVHNAMLAAVQARQEDYGAPVFQVSAHAGARPLCYPYQGKFYSWDNTSGTMKTGDGRTIHYEPLNSTSYGQPAGLFGINCGHTPYPMIPGVSIPADEEIQSPEENSKEYLESQQQRALEREIRKAKRDLEMLGDLATQKDRNKVKEAQAVMRAFIKETGRTRRYDREQIYTAFKDAPPPPVQVQNEPPRVNTRQGATDALLNVFKEVNPGVKRIDEELYIANINRFLELNERFGCVTDRNTGFITSNKNGNAIAYTSTAYTNKREETNLGLVAKDNYDDAASFRGKELKYRDSFWSMPFTDDFTDVYSITHEYGHMLESKISIGRTDWEQFEAQKQEYFNMHQYNQWRNANLKEEEKQAKIIYNEIVEIAKERNSEFKLAENLSKYGRSNYFEFFAETFANAFCGAPNELGEAMIEWLRREGYQ